MDYLSVSPIYFRTFIQKIKCEMAIIIIIIKPQKYTSQNWKSTTTAAAAATACVRACRKMSNIAWIKEPIINFARGNSVKRNLFFVAECCWLFVCLSACLVNKLIIVALLCHFCTLTVYKLNTQIHSTRECAIERKFHSCYSNALTVRWAYSARTFARTHTSSLTL